MTTPTTTRDPLPGATDKDKALAIARDVLDQLAQRAYRRGVYLMVPLSSGLRPRFEEQLQALVPQLEARCQVCLLGSALLSKIKLYDDCTAGQLWLASDSIQAGGHHVRDHLEPIFGWHQLAMLESFFEGRVVRAYCPDEELFSLEAYDELRGAAVAGRGIHPLELRVRLALDNFLVNDGRLVVQPVNEAGY